MLERGLLARLYSPLILVTRQDFKNLGWSRYITGTNIRIISLFLNLLPVEKKIKKKEKTENPFLWWRGIFSFQFHKARNSYFEDLLSKWFIRNEPLIDPLQSLSLSHREYSECSKRSLDTSSSVGNWKPVSFVSPPRSIPTLFHARKEIIAQFKNRRGCARFLYHAPCPPWQGWKITRPLSSPVTRNENPSLHQETAFHSLKTQRTHTRTPGLIHILFMGRATGTGFSSDFSRVVLSPPSRFASPLFPNIAAAGCNVPRQ